MHAEVQRQGQVLKAALSRLLGEQAHPPSTEPARTFKEEG